MSAAVIFVLLVTAGISGVASPATSFPPQEGIAPDFNATDVVPPSPANGSDVGVAITDEEEVASSNESRTGVEQLSTTAAVTSDNRSEAPAADQSLPMQFVFWPDDNDRANVCRALDFSCWNVEKGLHQCGKEIMACSCHPRCLVFRNCCPDFPQVCPAPYKRAVELYRQSPDVNTTCLAYSMISVITSCSPPFSNDETLVRECARPIQHNDSDRVPSADRRTGLHFLNKACAVCNGADKDDVEPFSSTFELSRGFVRVSDVNNPHDITVLMKDIFRNADTSQEVIVVYAHEDEVLCPQKLISGCPEDNQDEVLSLRCSSYTNYVGSTKNLIYKNPHCLQCHQFNECIAGKNSFTKSGGYFPRSFSLIMDRAKAGGDKNKVQILSTRYNMNWAKIECTLQNSSVLACHQTQCNELYELRNGSCQRKSTVWNAVLLVSWNEESNDHSNRGDNDPESSEKPNEKDDIDDEVDDITNSQDEAGDDSDESKSQDQSKGDDASTPGGAKDERAKGENSGQNSPDLIHTGPRNRNHPRWGRSVPGFKAMPEMRPPLRSSAAEGGLTRRAQGPSLRGNQQADRDQDRTTTKTPDSDDNLLSTTDPSQSEEAGPAWVQEALSLLKTHFASAATSPEMNATWESPGPGVWRYRLVVSFWALNDGPQFDLRRTFVNSAKQALARPPAAQGNITFCLAVYDYRSPLSCARYPEWLFHLRTGTGVAVQVTPSPGTGTPTGAAAAVVALATSVAILYPLL